MSTRHEDIKKSIQQRFFHQEAKDDDIIIEEGEIIGVNNNNDFGNDYDFIVAIEDNGKTISITTTSSSSKDNNNIVVANENGTTAASSTMCSWKFSSALLWVNDPRYIHASSGQRIRTLGQYSKKYIIESARVIRITTNDNDDLLQPKLHPVPPQGSLHSRGGIYEDDYDYNTNDTRDDSSGGNNNRTLVLLKWNYGEEESIYDLYWLIDNALNNCLGRRCSNSLSDNVDDGIPDDSKARRDILQHGSSSASIKEEEVVGRSMTMMTSSSKVTKEISISSSSVGNTNLNNNDNNGVSIARFDYEEIYENEDILFKGMQEIFEHGAILVQNTPMNVENSNFSVGNLGRRLSNGNLSHGSLYGDIFHVQNKENANNIAYTNVALPPHQDLTYYESKPFLQLLHCVSTDHNTTATNNKNSSSSIVGGESVLVDGMAAAEELRFMAPDLFDILCNTEATFVKERHDTDIVSAKPHIVLDPTFNQVVEINWSPPFEGPLQMHPSINEELYIQAYQAMECMLDDNNNNNNDFLTISNSSSLEASLQKYAKDYTWEYALQKGDILVFNNQRMLHGRRSFHSIGNAKRHLIGCYTDAMDTISRYRQLLRKQKRQQLYHHRSGGGDHYGKRNPGNGSRWII